MAKNDGIQRVAPQHYRLSIDLPKGADGKRRRLQPTVHGTRAEAKAERDRIVAELAQGLNVGSAKQTLGEYLAAWLRGRESQVAVRTWQREVTLMKSVSDALGNVRLSDLSGQHLNAYYSTCLKDERTMRGATDEQRADGGKPLSPTTVHHRHVVLKMALRDAVKHHILAFNPCSDADTPKRKRDELKVLNEHEAKQLLAALAGTSSDLLAFVALYTGARLGELLALRWQDFDAEKQVLYIRRTVVEPLKGPDDDGKPWYSFKPPKSLSGRRAIDLDAATVERLNAHRKAQASHRLALPKGAWADLDLVFCNAVGIPQRPSRASRTFSKRAVAAGVTGFRFHDLRHTHATLLLMAGVPPHVVSKRLGHADVGFTLRTYADVLPSQARDAADAFASLMQGAKVAV